MSAPVVLIESTLTASAVRAIRFVGRFDRHSSVELLAAMRAALADDSRAIEIDLANAYYMDPAALGTMFMLREKARRSGKAVSVVY